MTSWTWSRSRYFTERPTDTVSKLIKCTGTVLLIIDGRGYLVGSFHGIVMQSNVGFAPSRLLQC